MLADPTSFADRPVEIEGSTALYPAPGHPPDRPDRTLLHRAVWGPYSYVQYETGDREFYDRTTDPWQLDNAYLEHPAPGSPQVLLQQWYDAHVDCREAACNDRLPAAVTNRAEPPAPARRTPYPRRVDTTTKTQPNQ